MRSSQTQSIHFLISFEALPENQAEFRAAMNSIQASLPTVNGCQQVMVFGHVENPRQFSLLETWDNQEAHQNHVEEMQSSGKWDQIRALLASDPKGMYLHLLK